MPYFKVLFDEPNEYHEAGSGSYSYIDYLKDEERKGNTPSPEGCYQFVKKHRIDEIIIIISVHSSFFQKTGGGMDSYLRIFGVEKEEWMRNSEFSQWILSTLFRTATNCFGGCIPGMPVKVILEGFPEGQRILDWVPSVEMLSVDQDYDELGFFVRKRRSIYYSWMSHGYLSELSGIRRRKFFEKIITETGDDLSCILNIQSCMPLFYKSLYDYNDPLTGVAAAFDYITLLLILAAYYMLDCTGMTYSTVKRHIIREITDNVKGAAKYIVKYMRKDLPCYHPISEESYPIPKTLQKYHREIGQYLSMTWEGDYFTFAGLISSIQRLRNATKGHGVIQNKYADVLQRTLLYYISYLHRFLAFHNFKIELADGFATYGYFREGDNIWEDGFQSEYIIGYSFPKVLWDYDKKGNPIYMDFFEGKLYRPGITE